MIHVKHNRLALRDIHKVIERLKNQNLALQADYFRLEQEGMEPEEPYNLEVSSIIRQ